MLTLQSNTDTRMEKVEYKKKVGRVSRRYNRIIQSSHDSVKSSDGYNVEFLNTLSMDITNAHKDLEHHLEEYRDLLEEEANKVDISETDKRLQKIQMEVSQIKGVIASVRTQNVECKSEKVDFHKHRKIEPPELNGDIREYPTFRRNYHKHMERIYVKDPYPLLSCLGKDVKATVAGASDDYDELMRRLNEKYGRAEKLTAAILKELDGLDRIEDGDSAGIINMVDVVEKCWLDLKRAGLKRKWIIPP